MYKKRGISKRRLRVVYSSSDEEEEEVTRSQIVKKSKEKACKKDEESAGGTLPGFQTAQMYFWGFDDDDRGGESDSFSDDNDQDINPDDTPEEPETHYEVHTSQENIEQVQEDIGQGQEAEDNNDNFRLVSYSDTSEEEAEVVPKSQRQPVAGGSNVQQNRISVKLPARPLRKKGLGPQRCAKPIVPIRKYQVLYSGFNKRKNKIWKFDGILHVQGQSLTLYRSDSDWIETGLPLFTSFSSERIEPDLEFYLCKTHIKIRKEILPEDPAE